MSGSKKNVSLAEYYSQLEKYESYKQPPLKKDNSLVGIRSEGPTHSNPSRADRMTEERYRPVPRQPEKSSFERRDYTNLEQFKRSKASDLGRSAFNESLVASNVRSDKWTDPIEEPQEERSMFSQQEEEAFVSHCQSLYQCRGSTPSLKAEIDKRDEVYQLVSENLGGSEDSARKLREYFEEHLLMAELIRKLKRIGDMEECESMTDLNNRLKLHR